MKVVIVGAGVIGMCAGILLAQDGHDVIVLERDPAEPVDPQVAWQSWERRGVNQFRLPNFVLSRFTATAEAELPDVNARLRAAGAWEHNIADNIPSDFRGAFRDEDVRYSVVTARRPVLEAAVAASAVATPNLTMRRGRIVRHLLARQSPTETPTINGVELDSGERLEADLVVDATGRRSALPRWIQEAGGSSPRVVRDDSGFVYYARHFRSADGSQPVQIAPFVQEYGSITALTLPADNGTWTVGLVTGSKDRSLRQLRDTDSWTRAVRLLPGAAHWIDADPIDDKVTVLANIEDRICDYAPGGSPVAAGVVAVGDSWSCSNPSLGRGLSIGLMHAVLLRAVLRNLGEADPRTLTRHFWVRTSEEMEPWYRSTRNYDRHRLAEMDAVREGKAFDSDDPEWTLTRQLQTGAFADADVLRAYLDLTLMLRPIWEMAHDDALLGALKRSSGDRAVASSTHPSRKQLEATVLRLRRSGR